MKERFYLIGTVYLISISYFVPCHCQHIRTEAETTIRKLCKRDVSQAECHLVPLSIFVLEYETRVGAEDDDFRRVGADRRVIRMRRGGFILF